MEAGGGVVTGDGPFRDPRWNWPEYPPGAVVELRVHGIGGEGPEGMARDPHPVRVGGDEGVGFWRARNPVVQPPLGPAGLPPEVPEDGDDQDDQDGEDQPDDRGPHVREVVSWGGTTSGASRSAFWVLLLPFALFNAAGRMTRPGAGPRRIALHQGLCRVLALSMTVAVVALTMAVVIDLVAVQCGAMVVCREADLAGRWLLAPLREETLLADAAALVGLLALLPIVAVYLLRGVGRRGITRTGHPRPDVALRSTPAQRLDEDDFWHNLWPAWRLRGIHITAGYASAVAMLALVLPPLLPDLPTWVGPTTLAVGLGSLIGNTLVTAWPRTAASAPSTTLGSVILGLRALTLVALGTLLGTALAGPVEELVARWLVVLLAVVGAGGLLWALVQHVQDVLDPSTDGSGPSGAVRDAVTAFGVVAIALLANLAGDTRTPVGEALAALTGEPRMGDFLLNGAPQLVYRPLGHLVVVQTVLLLLLLGVSLGRSDREQRIGGPPDAESPFRTNRGVLPTAALPWNAGAPAVALVSLLLVTAVGSGFHGAVLDWLGDRAEDYAAVEAVIGGDDATENEEEGEGALAAVAPRSELRLALPWWQPWTALAVALTLLVFGVTAWAFWRRVRGSTPTEPQLAVAAARSLAGAPPPDGGPDVTDALDRLRREVVRSWQLRVLTERAGAALLTAVLLSTVAVGGGVVWLLRTRQFSPPPLASLWMLGLALVPALAVLAIRTAREDRGVRRQLGRIWDVLAFWPRLTHPFAPPSYGEALVPAVAARTTALLATGHPVLLAGHSQGSVVALAATLQLPPRQEQLHLVTYGSPLRLLYEGLFPNVFGTDAGAIALATPGDPAAAPAPSVTPPDTWHNVLALGEPIGTPLWHWSVADEVGAGGDVLQGWDALLTVPWDSCPACGWARPPAAVPPGGPAAIDCTITDPDRMTSPAGEVDGVVAGHASYHRSREFDIHLHHLAGTATAG